MKKYGFAEFKSDFEKTMVVFKNEMAAFPWENKEAYAKWCVHTYHYVCHSTRLLAFAAARCDLSQQSAHRRFLEHLNEEKGHEKLAVNDLKKLGHTVDDFKEMVETALFYQNQYYWLNYHGAQPFFGWILALEGGAVHTCHDSYTRVAKAHGPDAGMFLKVHAEEDVDHLEKALNEVKSLPPEMIQQISKNFEQSSQLYFSVLRRISAEARKSEKKNAA